MDVKIHERMMSECLPCNVHLRKYTPDLIKHTETLV